MPGCRLCPANAPTRIVHAGRRRTGRGNVVVFGSSHAMYRLRCHPCPHTVVCGTVSAYGHIRTGGDCPPLGVGISWQCLLEVSGRSERTLRRWIKRWRMRALHSIKYLSSLLQHQTQECNVTNFLATEALPQPYRKVAWELRLLDTIGALPVTANYDNDINGWVWANLRFGKHPVWF